MSEPTQVKRRIGLIASLVFAASLASCAIVPVPPFGFPHVVDLTIGGHGHYRGGHHHRRGHRHHRRHRHHRHGGGHR